MGKIMDFIKGKDKELAPNTAKYTLYDEYITEDRANTYEVVLKRAGKQTKVVEVGDKWQLWWRD